MPKDKESRSRREILRLTAMSGLIAGFGAKNINTVSPNASAKSDVSTESLSYQEHQEALFSEHGDLIGTTYLSGSDMGPTPFSIEPSLGGPPKCESIGIECGGGTSTTEEPTPEPTPDPTPEPNDGPVARISANSNIAVDSSASFSGSSSYDSDGYISSYHWDFGDGTTASGESVTHAYSDTGRYTVDLRVYDNDGASDTVSKTITVGNQWRINLDYDDGATITEDVLEVADDAWKVIASNGEEFFHQGTQSVADAVESFLEGALGDAESEFQYPSVKSSFSIDMTSDSSYTISSSQVDNGDVWVGGLLPNWADTNIPPIEYTYADWESGGLAEAAAVSNFGAAYGMSVVCSEFTPSTSSVKSGYIHVNYDWSGHLAVVLASAGFHISPFVRNVTTGDENIINHKNPSQSLFSLDLKGDWQYPSVWYDHGSEKCTIPMTDNGELDLRFKEGHTYQVGVRLLLSTGASDHTGGATARGMVADQTTDDVNHVGNKQLLNETIRGGNSDIQNGVQLDSIELEWY